jgi:hypothetical protein
MTVEGIRRRLDKLAQSTALARFESVASTLDRAAAEPPLLLDPPPPATARRIDREAWRTIAHMDAREKFLLAGRFDELRAAYAMPDAELWQRLWRSAPTDCVAA